MKHSAIATCHLPLVLLLAACAPAPTATPPPAASIAISTAAPALTPLPALTARPTGKTDPIPQPTAVPALVWVNEGVRLKPSDFGVAAGEPVADVSAAILPDGRVRLYAFAQRQGIVSAISRDGLNFTPEPGARLPDGYGMPRIVTIQNGWRMFFISQSGIGSATSANGLNFTIEPGMRVRASAHGLKDLSGPSIVAAPGGGYRMYYSDLPKPGAGPSGHTVFGATSSDLLNWTPDAGFRFGATDVNDRANSAEHPFVLRAQDGTYWMFFFRLETMWAAKSSDGIAWTDAESLGFLGNDPDVVVLPDGVWRMYYGDFDPQAGGFIFSARQVAVTWSVSIKSAPGGPQGFGFQVAIAGASEKPLALQVTQRGKPVEGVTIAPASGKPPFQVSFTIPGQTFGATPVLLEVNDGNITRQFTLTPPPPQ